MKEKKGMWEMKRNFKKFIALGCAVGLLLTGCGKNETSSSSSLDFKKYPIETEVTLTYKKA